MYKVPIDSYVLKGSGIQEIKNKTCSTLDADEYEKVIEFLGEQRDFLWELERWEDFSDLYASASKDSYAEYYKKHNKGID